MTAFNYTAAFVLGLCVGSFLNVCIYRLPAGKSIVSPPSACPQCDNQLVWYHNIPVFSYLVLRGRCAFCRVAIPLRYPFVEILTGCLFLLTVYSFGLTPPSLVYCLFLSLLVIICFIDIDHQIIPDVISLPGILVGFLGSFFVPWVSWTDSLLGVLIGGGILWAIAWIYEVVAKREGMGGGDIKLLAMLGAFLGWKAVLPVVFIASLSGTVIGVPVMLLNKQNSKLAIPFGPFLAFGAVVYLFWGQDLILWYLSFF